MSPPTEPTLAPPLPPLRALTIDVVHLEEEFEFVHGVAVDEEGQRVPQLLEGDGATSIGVKEGEESLGKEGLWPEKGGRWAQRGGGARALKACGACAHAPWGGGLQAGPWACAQGVICPLGYTSRRCPRPLPLAKSKFGLPCKSCSDRSSEDGLVSLQAPHAWSFVQALCPLRACHPISLAVQTPQHAKCRLPLQAPPGSCLILHGLNTRDNGQEGLRGEMTLGHLDRPCTYCLGCLRLHCRFVLKLLFTQSIHACMHAFIQQSCPAQPPLARPGARHPAQK